MCKVSEMKLLTLFLAVWILMPASHGKTPSPEADTIFVSGNAYTGATPARAEAIAVRRDRIAAVGTNAEIQKLKGKNTRVVDLGGRFVMPGFNDAHLHLASGGLAKLRVDLVGTKSLQEMKSRIAEHARATAPGEWITGRGWDHTLWAEQKLPFRQDIDAVTGGRPALFVRVDGHIGVANSAALKAAKIGRDTPDPPGGKIDRDDTGEPTGIVRETALAAVQGKVPAPSPAQRRRGIELALAEAAQWGVTSLQDNSQWADFLVYEELAREGKLTARISEWLPFEAPLPTLQNHRSR
ncbi:MAG TPA: amidohydrolase family protein, partial [Terriglobales bacterium]|nr:amidohydrolase family protein [Terriglobales bacterium]